MKPTTFGRTLAALFTLSAIQSAIASGYGVYDTRTLAMGGTGAAVGDINTGHFYNPALMAFHDGHEDRTRDGLHSLQLVVAALSDGARTAADAIADDLEGELSNAIDNLNNVPTPQTARAGIDAAEDLEDAMQKLRGKDVTAEAYAGFSTSLPADREGGAFFVGTRAIGQGQSRIEDTDFELLNDYVEALQFVESDGAAGSPHPELRDTEGRLIDPSSQIRSSAEGAAVLLSEVGVAAAKEFRLWDQDISFGIAPKVVHIRAFEETWQVIDGEFSSGGSDTTDLYFNADVGVAMTLADVFRLGLAVKDIRRKTVQFPSGEALSLEPRSRLGLAYLSKSWRVGLDADLAKTANLRRTAERQDVSLGMEYDVLSRLSLRAGYRHDLEDSAGDQLSGGLGLRLGRFALDLTYCGGDSEGAALHLGWAH